MTFLLPTADGVADEVARRLPQATIARYEDGGHDLGEVDFYCLPYMGDGPSVAMIAQMPRLLVLQSLSSGIDNILGSVPEQVTLCNGSGLHHEESTAELAVSLILASLRQLPRFALDQSRHRWQHVRTDSLDAKKVLLVGYGGMGKAIEERLAPFGARITRSSRTARDGVAPLSQLPRLAADTDILVVCIALTPGTCGLIGEEVLAALPDGAMVVNVARGPIVDAAALVRHLTDGRLRAALDVTDIEPLPADRPEWALPNVLITPHIGGDTFAFARRAPGFVADQAERHVSGQPLANIVKPAGRRA
ncbi:MAG TPA: 2-hydroxyacid dehydrogenase [Streptosporangiaceae bacterium]|jgi:phosphoglycerate dehydrogenase-like enzyme